MLNVVYREENQELKSENARNIGVMVADIGI